MIERDKLTVEWTTPEDHTEEFRVLDYRHIITRQRYPKWKGVKIIKHPTDLVLYHQAIWSNQPEFIVETGTRWGGSALFYASMMDLVGRGKVVSIDIAPLGQPRHPRIIYLQGSSVDRNIVDQVKALVNGSCMVILDSSHRRRHVKWELRHYAPLVTKGQFLVIEDCYMRGRNKLYEPGEARDWFLRHTKKFKQTDYDNQFLSTSTRGGWLKRI